MKIIDENNSLYETDEVVIKYTKFHTRNRQLNIPERQLVDKYNIWNKEVLILGGGGGRVPSNLILLNNHVTSIELSNRLFELSLQHYPKDQFLRLNLIKGNVLELDKIIENKKFDLVFFPMNGIDYLGSVENQINVFKKMNSCLKKGGILSFTSHNNKGYFFTTKIPWKNKKLRYIFKNIVIDKENVVGGGTLIKSSPTKMLNNFKEFRDLEYTEMIFDKRNRFESLISKLWVKKYFFPYIMYVFRKK